MMLLSSVLLVSILLGAAFLISESGGSSTKSKTSFECGFLPNTKAASSLNLQFLLLMLLFVIFDTEVVLLLYVIFEALPVFYLVLWLMLITLWFEWKLGQVKWFE